MLRTRRSNAFRELPQGGALLFQTGAVANAATQHPRHARSHWPLVVGPATVHHQFTENSLFFGNRPESQKTVQQAARGAFFTFLPNGRPAYVSVGARRLPKKSEFENMLFSS